MYCKLAGDAGRAACCTQTVLVFCRLVAEKSQSPLGHVAFWLGYQLVFVAVSAFAGLILLGVTGSGTTAAAAQPSSIKVSHTAQAIAHPTGIAAA
jgi:hypothetical protein